MFVLFSVILVIEYATTVYGILSGKAKELNPILNAITKKLGLPVMFFVKLTTLLLAILCAVYLDAWWFYILYGIPYVVIDVVNIRTLLKSGGK